MIPMTSDPALVRAIHQRNGGLVTEPCGCGCGALVTRKASSCGRTGLYVNQAHWRRARKVTVPCGCGCGTVVARPPSRLGRSAYVNREHRKRCTHVQSASTQRATW